MLRIECAIKSLHLRIRHNIIYAISLTRGATDRVPFVRPRISRCPSLLDVAPVALTNAYGPKQGGHLPNGEHGV